MLEKIKNMQKSYIEFCSNEKLDIEKICVNLANTNNCKLFVATIDGKKCKTTEEMFNEFKIKLKFPEYFGHNWDALDECINDLDWIDADSYLLIVENIDAILKKFDEDFKIFINILYTTTDEWSKGNNPIVKKFHLVFTYENEQKDMVVEKLKKAGLDNVI